MTPLKQLEKYNDNFPLLELRITILKFALQIRNYIRIIIQHPSFESLSIAIICLNSITLALEDPVNG